MKRLLFMKSGAGWFTGDEVSFSREHPYQLVDDSEAVFLLQDDRFEEASKTDLKKFYNLKED
jgi:hypothetical protein